MKADLISKDTFDQTLNQAGSDMYPFRSSTTFKMIKETRQRDIARSLGLSVSTVSKALSGNEAIGKETRQRVEHQAKALSYCVNNYARNLRLGRTQMVAVILPDIREKSCALFLSGLEHILTTAKYLLIVCQSMHSQETELKLTASLFESGIDGLIILSSSRGSKGRELKKYVAKGIPVVVLGPPSGVENVLDMPIPYEKAAYFATSHLLNRGFSNLALINGSSANWLYAEYLDGYTRPLKESGKKGMEANIYEDLEKNDVQNCIQKLLSQTVWPDAIVISDYLYACSFIKEIKSMQTLTGKHTKIIALAGPNEALVTEESLSSVEIDFHSVGFIAGLRLLAALESKLSGYMEGESMFLPTINILKGFP